MSDSSDNGFRTILRSSSIIGGAQIVSIAARLVKMKFLAVLLGPAGVGLAGIFISLMETAAAIAALGWGTVGTKQIAAANAADDEAAVARVSYALMWGSLGLAIVGSLMFWAISRYIARDILQLDNASGEVAWLALGVGLTVAAGSQAALLSGLRRIADLARVNVAANVLGAALGVAAIYLWGRGGLIAMVLITPAITFLLGRVYLSRLNLAKAPQQASALAKEWGAMTALGIPFMGSGLITAAGFLIARTLVQNDLGTDALGHFQAAWAITMTYLGFILAAMGTDYFPRLSEVIGDHKTVRRIVNEQTEVALLLCGPMLLAMLSLAPWVIQILYSSEFAPAVDILRWQLLGDILKILSWPMGFVVLALGAGRVFIFNQLAGMTAFLAGIYFGIPYFGVEAAGMAFIAIYAVTLPINWMVVRNRTGLRWNRAVLVEGGALIGAAILIAALARHSEWLAAFVGMALTAAFGIAALLRISDMAELSGKLAKLAQIGRRLRQWTRPRP
uniref:O-antigen translocase n=1 Tax=uncultured Erythrobacter sp. TaxID=263913 RepID=UPI002609F825|nr:O-antigen translocase [uncultured Erythrobacter sp.]